MPKGLLGGLILFALAWSGCQKNENKEMTVAKENTLFELLDSATSGITFTNTIESNDQTNILNYEYLYNGGGVGIGDFNNDSLPDIIFVGNQVPCQLYLNKFKYCSLHFEDITATSGITNKQGLVFGVSVVDINQDGLQDIYLSVGGPGDGSTNKLFINQGLDQSQNPYFKEMASEYGLNDSGQSVQAVFFDYDKDGDLDLYQVVTSGFERSPTSPLRILTDGSAKNTDRLYKNDYNEKLEHPVFTNVSAQAGILEEGFGLGVALLDINEDGWLDLYIDNDYISNDLLYVNNRNGTFSEKLSSYFKHTSHFAMGNDVGDMNNDGLLDIVSVDMLPEEHYWRKLMSGASPYNMFYYAVSHGYAHQYMRNTLQLNNGNGSFSEIGHLAGIYKTDWSWSVLFVDFDNDELQDLFITNGFRKDIMDLDFVKFRSTVLNKIKDPEKQRKLLLDCLAVRPGRKVPNHAYKNNGNLTFSHVTKDWGFDFPTYSSGAAYVDLDRDGDLDIVVNNIDDIANVFRNKTRDNHPESNYLNIKLAGFQGNRSAIGSKVSLRYKNKLQRKLHSVVRGFASTMEETLHFGLGSEQQVDTVEVQWPDGNVSTLTNVKVNQTIELNQSSAVSIPSKGKRLNEIIFEAQSPGLIPYRHEENDFIDFNYDPMLPHKLSQGGPGIAVGDVNQDGLEDLYIGGALLKAGTLLLQRKNGTFENKILGKEDFESEDMGCLFFDADNDNDLDLYVVSGGNEYTINNKRNQDRLYLNDGKGKFLKNEKALPETQASGSCVISADYDQDGDLDLFVGGRVWSDAYPKSPRSYLLQNDGQGKFKDVTKDFSSSLEQPGMVTGALWTDFDNDGWIDLAITGEYMPVCFFRNENGEKFVKNENDGLENSEGWWNSLTGGDFDSDGDVDYIAGNLGLNTPYKASISEPLNVIYKDFDNNGSMEAITSYYEDGINFPTPSLDAVTAHLPVLKKYLLHYRAYANTSTNDFLKMAGQDGVQTLEAKTLQSAYIENRGNGKFNLRPLPVRMQFAPVYGVLANDVNNDGKLDFIAVGNSYAPEVVVGRYDAFTGEVMLGDGKGNFEHMDILTSGFFVDGDAKGLVNLNSGNERLIIATQNNDSVSIFKIKNQRKLKQVMPDKKEMTALLKHQNGTTTRMELNYGSGYLSQSSRSIVISPDIKQIKLFDVKGEQTRTISY